MDMTQEERHKDDIVQDHNFNRANLKSSPQSAPATGTIMSITGPGKWLMAEAVRILAAFLLFFVTVVVASLALIWQNGCSQEDFRCPNGPCISRDKFCDGTSTDCPSGEDEREDFCGENLRRERTFLPVINWHKIECCDLDQVPFLDPKTKFCRGNLLDERSDVRDASKFHQGWQGDGRNSTERLQNNVSLTNVNRYNNTLKDFNEIHERKIDFDRTNRKFLDGDSAMYKYLKTFPDKHKKRRAINAGSILKGTGRDKIHNKGILSLKVINMTGRKKNLSWSKFQNSAVNKRDTLNDVSSIFPKPPATYRLERIQHLIREQGKTKRINTFPVSKRISNVINSTNNSDVCSTFTQGSNIHISLKPTSDILLKEIHSFDPLIVQNTGKLQRYNRKSKTKRQSVNHREKIRESGIQTKAVKFSEHRTVIANESNNGSEKYFPFTTHKIGNIIKNKSIISNFKVSNEVGIQNNSFYLELKSNYPGHNSKHQIQITKTSSPIEKTLTPVSKSLTKQKSQTEARIVPSMNQQNKENITSPDSVFREKQYIPFQLHPPSESDIKNTANHPVCFCERQSVVKCQRLRRIPDTISPQVTKLVLAENQISTIDPSIMLNYPFLSEELHLEDNAITELFPELFRAQTRLKRLFLNGNGIHKIAASNCIGLRALTDLHLHKNQLHTLELSCFAHTPKLTTLLLSSNQLTLEGEQFPELKNLTTLYLQRNRIPNINMHLFANLISLKTLSLQQNVITDLHPDAFKSLRRLEALDLSNNPITSVAGIFRFLSLLQSLNLRGLRLNSTSYADYHNLTSLKRAYFPVVRFCIFLKNIEFCQPMSDGITTREDLMHSPLLRICVWFVATVTAVGNGAVLLCRQISAGDDQVLVLFVKNLALADLLMGVYLMIVGIYDHLSRGQFFEGASDWSSSFSCTVAGCLALISCEASVFIMTFMSLQRYLSITRTFSGNELSPNFARQSLVVIWLTSIALALFPVTGMTTFYGLNAMCFPLHISEPYLEGWKFSAFVFLGLNSFSMLVIVVSYTSLFQNIRTTRSQTPLAKTDLSFVLRILFIVLTDCVCWLPILAIKVIALAGIAIPGEVYAWLVVLVLPINSAINPILYTFSTTHFVVKLRKIVRRIFPPRKSTKSFDLDRLKFSSKRNPDVVVPCHEGQVAKLSNFTPEHFPSFCTSKRKSTNQIKGNKKIPLTPEHPKHYFKYDPDTSEANSTRLQPCFTKIKNSTTSINSSTDKTKDYGSSLPKRKPIIEEETTDSYHKSNEIGRTFNSPNICNKLNCVYRLNCKLKHAIFSSSVIVEGVNKVESRHFDTIENGICKNTSTRNMISINDIDMEGVVHTPLKRNSSDSTSTCYTRLPSKASEEGSFDACQELLRSYSTGDAEKRNRLISMHTSESETELT